MEFVNVNFNNNIDPANLLKLKELETNFKC